MGLLKTRIDTDMLQNKTAKIMDLTTTRLYLFLKRYASNSLFGFSKIISLILGIPISMD